MTELQNMVLDCLQKEMEENGYQTKLMQEEGSMDSIRILMDNMGSEQNGEVLMELSFLPFPANEPLEDLNLFQIFTTVETNIAKEKTDGILKELNRMNLECVLGSFHVFEEEMQVYHRYVSVTRGNSKEEILAILQPAINWISNSIDEYYDELIDICRK